MDPSEQEAAPRRRARILVDLENRRLEVEGTEEFVGAYAESVDRMLAALLNAERVLPLEEGSGQTQEDVASRARPRAFSEILSELPDRVSDNDRVLVAAAYVQAQSADSVFTTGEVGSLLVEHGIRVANASENVKRNISARRVFVVQRGQFRVSRIGDQYIAGLLSGEARN